MPRVLRSWLSPFEPPGERVAIRELIVSISCNDLLSLSLTSSVVLGLVYKYLRNSLIPNGGWNWSGNLFVECVKIVDKSTVFGAVNNIPELTIESGISPKV